MRSPTFRRYCHGSILRCSVFRKQLLPEFLHSLYQVYYQGVKDHGTIKIGQGWGSFGFVKRERTWIFRSYVL
jgi:hypothetical protein